MTSVRFLSEVSSNHHQSIVRCVTFIETAARIGCWGAKFQLFQIDKLFAPEALKAKPELLQRQAWELPRSFLPGLAHACHNYGLQFVCTPFDLDAVDALYPHVDVYKIASYSLLWDTFLAHIAQTGKPVILSTGMATLEEIRHAVETLGAHGCINLSVLHCISGYPTPLAECNLAAIETLAAYLYKPIGLSDHSRSPAVLYRAVHAYGAGLIEFHLDLDGTGDEYRTGHCWLPEEIGPVIQTINDGFLADGSGIKEPQPSEISDRAWRADPSDGLRPLTLMRERLTKGYEGIWL